MDACVGVDGARSGWVAVWRGQGGLAWHVYGNARALVHAHRDAAAIAVDVPIGLSDHGGRLAEREARRFVGGRRACSIFSTPVRGILDAKTQSEASECHRRIDGRGFGAQSFAILSKIREWDALLRSDPQARRVVHEVHPEVSFAALAGGAGQGIVASKHTPAGVAARSALLAAVFGEIAIADLLQAVPQREAKTDDVLDALAALWTAERIRDGVARSLPAEVKPDAVGLDMVIWY
jgi:predicted RNase H-like nuclease